MRPTSTHYELVLSLGRHLMALYDDQQQHPMSKPPDKDRDSLLLMRRIHYLQKHLARYYEAHPETAFFRCCSILRRDKRLTSIPMLTILAFMLARLVYMDEDAHWNSIICRLCHCASPKTTLVGAYRWVYLMKRAKLIEPIEEKTINKHLTLTQKTTDAFFYGDMRRKKPEAVRQVEPAPYAKRFGWKPKK